MDELGLEVCVHAIPFEEPASDGDGFNRVVDAFRPHRHDLNAFTVSHVVSDGPSHGGGITFCGDLERHDPNQEWLLLSLRSDNTLP